MKILANISRIFVAVVFLFSGFVKGVDPLGFTYRVEDYFIAFGVEWAIPLALFLTIFLCAVEFALGAALLFNFGLKYLAWPLLLMMVFFFGLTLNDAINNPVPDCGCFGDALKLTNWQTFYKNVVLIFPVILIFIYRNKYKSVFLPRIDYLAVTAIFLGFSLFSFYQYRHLPWIDFLGWKKGADLVPDNPGLAKTYLTYRNKISGETKEYLSPNYPWNDSVWMAEWQFDSQRIDDSGVIKGHSLKIFDAEGNDFTETFVNNPGYQFLVASYSLGPASRKGFEKIDKFFGEVLKDGHSLVVLTGSLEDEIQSFKQGLHPDLEFYNADDVELKMMVRANPGVILLKDGVVMEKWHWRDLPDYAELKEDFPGL
ncbi:MAG: DoxX family protein [Bacteroidales bacterium]|nr:DoxX family protein [Bacteroidales bacterium]